MGCQVGPKGPEHFFAKRVRGIWTCVCGERRDGNGQSLAHLKVVSE